MRSQEPLRSVSQPLLRVPLRAVLIIPFLLQISIAVGLTAFVSLRNGQDAVNDITSQLRDEVTARIAQHLADYVETPQLVTQINANAAQFGTLDLQNAASLERHFWQQMSVFDSLRPIAFGSEQGMIHSVDQVSNGSLVIRVIDSSTNGEYHTYSIDQQGNRDRLLEVNTTFDPRTRPWYVKAVQVGQPAWTEVYPYFSTLGLAISATCPLYDETGQPLGVTNATLSLAELGNFLSSLKIGRSGQTFIMERSGNLIASSTTERPFRVRQVGGEETRERIAAIASQDPVTRQTAKYINRYFGNFNNIRQSQQFAYVINGHQYLIQVAPFRDRYGLDWLIVVVVPEADFMEHVEANTRTTILLCLIALAVSALIGILTSYCIARPIARVIMAARAISDGKLAQTIASRAAKNIKELDELTQAFNQMSTQLQASFTALETVNEQLEERVEQRTAELQERSIQLNQAVEELQTLHHVKDDFLSTVSHELRTPVSNMKLAIHMLRLAPSPERQQQYLNILETECKREVDLINDLLDLQRLEAGDQPITLQPINLQEWLPPIIQPFRSRLQDRQQLFTLNLPATTQILYSNPDSLGRLLAELLNNACKYTPAHGEICFTLGQSFDTADDESDLLITQFEIRNQAEIPPEQIPHLFEKFYRVPNADVWNQGGTGLGLALVKKLVEQLGGEITINSENGWTTFAVIVSSSHMT